MLSIRIIRMQLVMVLSIHPIEVPIFIPFRMVFQEQVFSSEVQDLLVQEQIYRRQQPQ